MNIVSDGVKIHAIQGQSRIKNCMRAILHQETTFIKGGIAGYGGACL